MLFLVGLSCLSGSFLRFDTSLCHPFLPSSSHLTIPSPVLSSVGVCRPVTCRRPFASPSCVRSCVLAPAHLSFYFCPSVRPSVLTSFHSSIRPYVRLFVRPSVRASVRPSIRLSVRSLFVRRACLNVSVRPSVRPTARQIICLSIGLSVRSSVCTSVHLTASPPLSPPVSQLFNSSIFLFSVVVHQCIEFVRFA